MSMLTPLLANLPSCVPRQPVSLAKLALALPTKLPRLIQEKPAPWSSRGIVRAWGGLHFTA
eukprot:3523609-Amphidinium_carterae.1